MLIDWFTVTAQAVNFLILVWLLKRYLYQPILNAIDKREKRIAAELADADAKQVQAKAERDIFQSKNNKLDQERDNLLQQAKNDADIKREELLAEVEQDVEVLRIKHQSIMAKDAENLKKVLSRKTNDEVFAIARKTLKDLASISLEQQVIQVFIQQLSQLEKSAKADLVQALKTTSEPVLLTSAFELSDSERSTIHNAINATFGVDIDLTFSLSEDLISGIELKANGQKIAWNIADYLQLLEQEIVALIQENSTTVNQERPKNKTENAAKNKSNDTLTDNIETVTTVDKHHE
ncbi:F0F1 ATP synthase subunit B [Colwellia sp. MSW7]|uniref:ATP synthase subunit b n=1 Tax=Colwellia maritima TaxID=2912588 RepID=A0ABS9X217_9GAMM|nr:F0F1 ATP synthase subunit B [Colwellia maritima]MCI2284230.1 F0F1 ATP synthase subunit B [Colwellia maritima]